MSTGQVNFTLLYENMIGMSSLTDEQKMAAGEDLMSCMMSQSYLQNETVEINGIKSIIKSILLFTLKKT